MNTPNFITYKVLRGHYNGCDEVEISLPEGIRLAFRDGDVGPGLHRGHNHYIGFMRKSDWPENIKELILQRNKWLDVFDFDDLLFIKITDIKEIDPLPVYTSEEMMAEFELKDYYIVVHMPNRFDRERFERIKDSVSENPSEEEILRIEKECRECIVHGRFCEIMKIVNIEGPYSVTGFHVINHSIVSDKPYYLMELSSGMSLSNILGDSLTTYENRIVVKGEHGLFNSFKENVLEQIK